MRSHYILFLCFVLFSATPLVAAEVRFLKSAACEDFVQGNTHFDKFMKNIFSGEGEAIAITPGDLVQALQTPGAKQYVAGVNKANYPCYDVIYVFHAESVKHKVEGAGCLYIDNPTPAVSSSDNKEWMFVERLKPEDRKPIHIIAIQQAVPEGVVHHEVVHLEDLGELYLFASAHLDDNETFVLRQKYFHIITELRAYKLGIPSFGNHPYWIDQLLDGFSKTIVPLLNSFSEAEWAALRKSFNLRSTSREDVREYFLSQESVPGFQQALAEFGELAYHVQHK